MKLPIALAVLAAVASTYASPMPEGQDQVQGASVAPMTSDEFVTKYQTFCKQLLAPSDGTFGKIKDSIKKVYRMVDDYDEEEKKLRD
ncbi:hypothetical protein H4R35_006196, partial [Dimargaris xerosporica]